MYPNVSIIIVNWNGFKDTSELLESLKNITYPCYDIYVVDNNSSGNDSIELQKQFSDFIYLINSKKNTGFAGGNNIGIRYALEKNSEFILLINNDTTVEQSFLEPLIQAALNSPTAGITSPKINYYYEPQKIWSAGGKISSIRSSGFAVTGIDENTFDPKAREVEFASGCCLLIKSSVLLEIGLFDENYFLYLEDTDLCYRTLAAGYKILVIPSAKIYHKVKSSTPNKPLTIYYETRNRLYFGKKHFGKYFFISFTYILLTMIIKSIYWIISGNLLKIKMVSVSFADFFSGRMGAKVFGSNK